MNALSLSKASPRMSQGNRFCARSMARTTSPLSRVNNGMHSVQPVATSTIVNVWINEPAPTVTPCAAMGHHVDLTEPRRRIVPVVERPDRDFTPHRRIKANPPPLTTSRSDFGLDQQAINRGCADGEHQRSTGLVELEPAMPLQRRQQRRNHHLETLAADSI